MFLDLTQYYLIEKALNVIGSRPWINIIKALYSNGIQHGGNNDRN